MLATSLESLQDATMPPAPRIGIVIAYLGSGGAEKAVVVLANGLAERGYVVDLLTWHAARFYLKDVSPKVATVNLSAGRRPNNVQIIRFLMQYMRQKQPTVIFPHLEKPSLLVMVVGLLTGYRKIVPCIQIDLTAYATIHHKMQHRLRRRLLICLVAVLYRLSPRVVAVSEGAARTARRLFSPFGPSVQVIYNGFDYSVLSSKAQQPVEEVWLRHKTVPVIVTCGRLTQQKAQDTLLRAFAAVRGTMPVRLVILGEGEEREALLELARRLGVASDVSLPGAVADPIAWFAKTHRRVDRGRCHRQFRLPIRPSRSFGEWPLWRACPGRQRRGIIAGHVVVLKRAPDIDKAALRKHLGKFSVDLMIDGYLAAGSVCSQKKSDSSRANAGSINPLQPKINSCTLNRFPGSVQTRPGRQPAARASS